MAPDDIDELQEALPGPYRHEGEHDPSRPNPWLQFPFQQGVLGTWHVPLRCRLGFHTWQHQLVALFGVIDMGMRRRVCTRCRKVRYGRHR